MPPRTTLETTIAVFLLGASIFGCAGDSDRVSSSEAEIERSSTVLSDADVAAFRERFAGGFVARMKAAQHVTTASTPACADRAALLPYVDGLLATSRSDRAYAFMRTCIHAVDGADPAASVEALRALSRAALAVRHLDEGVRAVEAAAALAEGPVARAIALEHVVALRTAAPNDTNTLPAIRAGFDEDDAILVQELYAGEALTPAREAATLDLVDRVGEPEAAARLLQTLGAVMITNEFRYHDALHLWSSPRGVAAMRSMPATLLHQTLTLVDRALMNHRNNQFGYDQARLLLAAVVPYQAKDYLPFAPGYAPYDRDELAAGACESAFSKNPELAAKEADFIAAKLTPAAGLAWVDAARAGARAPKVDLEMFRATMLESVGDDAAANDVYWLARQVCPYSGRAIAGSGGTGRRLLSAVQKDSPKPVLAVPPPASFSRYVQNAAMLSRRQLDSVAFGLSFWFPYLDLLSSGGQGLYVTPTFQGMADTPAYLGLGYTSYRYPDDGRLFDDLDGSGGKTITASFAAVNDFVWGVTVHEAAHQFHGIASENVGRCITELFAAAKARNVFSSGYAATNEKEYFAVGVQHYAMPDSFLGYGGVSRVWYRQNDADLYAFLASIESSRGDMTKIACTTR